jgi:hypothetical protein
MGMQPVNEELLQKIDDYIEHLFVPPDAALEQNLKDADAAGLPAIAISPGQGRLMYLLAKMAGREANPGNRHAGRLQHHLPRAGAACGRQAGHSRRAAVRQALERQRSPRIRAIRARAPILPEQIQPASSIDLRLGRRPIACAPVFSPHGAATITSPANSSNTGFTRSI